MNENKQIPESFINEWEKRNGALVFSTVSETGIPNSIYASCVSIYDDKILVANNYFNKTLKNILAGSDGAILFITSDDKSYQVKGTVNYFTSGPEFNDMKKWNPEKHPGHGVAVLKIEEIYSGAEKLL